MIISTQYSGTCAPVSVELERATPRPQYLCMKHNWTEQQVRDLIVQLNHPRLILASFPPTLATELANSIWDKAFKLEGYQLTDDGWSL